MAALSSQTKPWPNSPCERGKYYGCPDPVWSGHKLVVMSDETWLDYGTLVAKQQETLRTQDRVLTDQKAVIAQLTAKLNDVTDRLEATRDARKKEKLAWLNFGSRKT